MDLLLKSLRTKAEIDHVIRDTEDKVSDIGLGSSFQVVVLRFGKSSDAVCMQLDDILYKAQIPVSRMADIYIVDVDDVPIYTQYFDISLIPAIIFFYNATHIKIDCNRPDNTKWIGSFESKQDFVDVVETVYRGGLYGKYIVTCPLPQDHIPKYDLLFSA
ncbi:thioredoxin-like protein [Blastocystis sp. ATCC 50177/Nand II]|uniref:Thioredoxin-like protein n=1 Tax=Blastocystis sp. subtype 1 (strain ATCC 50177 / NandII) TaxID=478820 RepID=A0A196SM81_BLAHN|nr:thioredoxin-like protein [Blastocystis sp. ATCC 50177/Nand II]